MSFAMAHLAFTANGQTAMTLWSRTRSRKLKRYPFHSNGCLGSRTCCPDRSSSSVFWSVRRSRRRAANESSNLARRRKRSGSRYTLLGTGCSEFCASHRCPHAGKPTVTRAGSFAPSRLTRSHTRAPDRVLHGNFARDRSPFSFL